MSKKQKITVTIGIPAHNEEANIVQLLRSILRQKGGNFVIEKIVVICDGCTDKTAAAARKLGTIYPHIYVKDDHRQLGKLRRLLQLFRVNTSDIVITFDGDVLLKDTDVIAKMVMEFSDPDVQLVSANSTPLREKNTLAAKLIYSWSRVWYEARAAYKDGHNLHNCRGCCLALRRNIAKQVTFPENIVSDSQYLYFYVTTAGYTFRFAKSASVLYRKAATVQDYVIQMHRSSPEKTKLKRLFGRIVETEYPIPNRYKVKAVLKQLTADPFYIIPAAVFTWYMNHYPQNTHFVKKGGGWITAASTKKAITVDTL